MSYSERLWRIKVAQILEGNGVYYFKIPEKLGNPTVEAWTDYTHGKLKIWISDVVINVNNIEYKTDIVTFYTIYENKTIIESDVDVHRYDPIPVDTDANEILKIFEKCMKDITEEFISCSQAIINPKDGVETLPEIDEELINYFLDDKLANEVTIGIITAITAEYVAVKKILHDPLLFSKRKTRNPLIYTIGEIRKGAESYKVVLHQCGMGNIIASTRATLLLEHFPKIHSLIMVGIAGGVPNPSDIEQHVRLGDIVISDEKGVIQYDFVKQEEDRRIHRHPPRPPSSRLLEAVKIIKAFEYENNPPWVKNIDFISKQMPYYKMPSIETDVLHDPEDVDRVIEHPKDPLREKCHTRVFYSPIASSGTLLKDPITRDLLNNKFNVKAIEMEASGIADATWSFGIGYLVIRGICDYCDTHKNDEWQLHASVVAAAYAKSLLDLL